MVLSSEEISILNGLIESTHNVSTYSYEIAVKGTMISGVATLVCVVIASIITWYFAVKMLNWARNEHDDEAKFWALVSIVVCFVVANIAINLVCYDPFMSIFAPEYVVIKMILQAASGVVT